MHDGMLNRRARQRMRALAPKLRAIAELGKTNPTVADMMREDLLAFKGGRLYGGGERTILSIAADIEAKRDPKKPRMPVGQTHAYVMQVQRRARRWIKNGPTGRAPGHIQQKLIQFYSDDKKGFELAVAERIKAGNGTVFRHNAMGAAQ